MTTYLSPEQVGQLLRPINPSRVSERDGNSHLEAYDVKAHLLRVFGFCRFSSDLLDYDCLYESLGQSSNGRDIVSVGYRARVRLSVAAPDGTVLATYTEAAAGGATNFPINKRADAHDFAIKTAESQALKRCAVPLGDQFGLSLYRKGSTAPVVLRTLVGAGEVTTETVDHGAPEVIPEDTPISDSPVVSPSGESEPAPPAPPADPEPETGVDTAAQVERVRAQVIEAMKQPKREAMMALTRIKLDAGKAHLLNEPTTTPKGDDCTVNVLLDEAIKVMARGLDVAS